jgi:hypothetical protein
LAITPAGLTTIRTLLAAAGSPRQPDPDSAL